MDDRQVHLPHKIEKKTLVANAYFKPIVWFHSFFFFFFFLGPLKFHVFMFAFCIAKLIVFIHFKMCHTCVNIFTYPTSTHLYPQGKDGQGEPAPSMVPSPF